MEQVNEFPELSVPFTSTCVFDNFMLSLSADNEDGIYISKSSDIFDPILVMFLIAV